MFYKDITSIRLVPPGADLPIDRGRSHVLILYRFKIKVQRFCLESIDECMMEWEKLYVRMSFRSWIFLKITQIATGHRSCRVPLLLSHGIAAR